MDRFRDFREVFSTEAGNRVLAQIIDISNGAPIGASKAGDHGFLAFREGMRNVGYRVVQLMEAVPIRPEEQTGDERE